jgi:hypothetical protein
MKKPSRRAQARLCPELSAGIIDLLGTRVNERHYNDARSDLSPKAWPEPGYYLLFLDETHLEELDTIFLN